MRHTRGSTVTGCRAAALVAILCAASGPAGAQTAEPVGQAGLRIAIGQVAVVGGNSAGARERALDAALRQAVAQALSEILDAQTRAVQARAIRTLEGRARSFVKRYRALEEGEANGLYSVRIEAEVDDSGLRRATERWAPALPAPGGARAGAPSLLVVVSGAAEAGPTLVAALVALGVNAQLGDPSLTEPARALQAAAKATLTAVAFVSASVTEEGTVRGPGKEAIACRLTAKVFSVPTGQTRSEQNASLRIFADRRDQGRVDCLTRAATEIAGNLHPSPSVSSAAGADLRAITLDVDIVEPAAVIALLKTLRGLGSVSSAELRRVAGGRAEIRVRTRLLGSALATSLSRETSAVITLTDVEILGDLIRTRVRLRPSAPPASLTLPSSTAPAAAAPLP